MNRYNLILNTTTICNYNCSYCDVIKNNKKIKRKDLDNLIYFIEKNYKYINRFKFFGGEPLLVFEDIKYIIKNTKDFIGNKFEIVTNTSLLNDDIGEYFKQYFEIIFLSIDAENLFDYDKVFSFIKKFNLEEKVYFNLIIIPGAENISYNQFLNIYKKGYKNFNILPVYYTKIWDKKNLLDLTNKMKKILDQSLIDKTIKLYGFQDNSGYNKSLVNDSIFIDIDLNIYYSDFVTTKLGREIKEKLFLGSIDNFSLSNSLDMSYQKEELIIFEESIVRKVKGQENLHRIMDYFSKYLNKKKGIIKD
ncbi:MAG: radical SAM protein [Candidatus Gracilibacteria bacterium]